MGEKDDFELGVLAERVNNVEKEQSEQKYAMEKLKEKVNQLENNDSNTKIYVKQIFDMLNDIQKSLDKIKEKDQEQVEHKSRKVFEVIRQIAYIVVTGVLAAFSTYYGTLASLAHRS